MWRFRLRSRVVGRRARGPPAWFVRESRVEPGPSRGGQGHRSAGWTVPSSSVVGRGRTRIPSGAAVADSSPGVPRRGAYPTAGGSGVVSSSAPIPPDAGGLQPQFRGRRTDPIELICCRIFLSYCIINCIFDPVSGSVVDRPGSESKRGGSGDQVRRFVDRTRGTLDRTFLARSPAELFRRTVVRVGRSRKWGRPSGSGSTTAYGRCRSSPSRVAVSSTAARFDERVPVAR